MFVNFFIDRPIFASVLAIVIVVAGAVAIPLLPIAMFPEITPPQVVVTGAWLGTQTPALQLSALSHTPEDGSPHGVPLTTGVWVHA